MALKHISEDKSCSFYINYTRVDKSHDRVALIDGQWSISKGLSQFEQILEFLFLNK
jgi:hypothetical protein